MNMWIKPIIILILILISQSASASIWIDDIEIGLAPYQSSGSVYNKLIIRAEHSNIENIYIETSEIEIIHYIEGHQKIKANGNEFYIYDKIKIDIGV